MRLTRFLPVLSLAAAFAGCSRHATEPKIDPAAGAPRLVASLPAARATGVLYDTNIWGEFDRDLDPATVNDRTAFLKLDGQRAPCIVTYDAASRRVWLDPTVALVLQRTYTVEFSSSILSAAGVPVPPKQFFQFTTNSLRRIVYDFPARDSLVGPVSMLGWGGTQGPLDDIFFEVYAGTDSLAVEQRQVPYLQRTVFTRLLPFVAWPRGERVYWAITSHNGITNERLDGPVMSFRVLDPSALVEIIEFRPRDHGSANAARTQYCSNTLMPVGPQYNAAIHWNLSEIPADAWIVSASVELVAQASYTGRFQQQQPSLWLSQGEWLSCAVLTPGPPYAEAAGLLSEATMVDDARVRFDAPRLAAFFEAQLRNDIYTHGTLVRALQNVFYESPLTFDLSKQPRATIRFVRRTPGVSR